MTIMKTGVIYKITNLINNKTYIGQTIQNPKDRFYQHKRNSIDDSSKEYNYPLYRAFRKYGVDNFSFEIIEENIEQSELCNKEKNYIIFYNSHGEGGYNQTLETTNPMLNEEVVNKVKQSARERVGRRIALVNEGVIVEKFISLTEAADKYGLSSTKIFAVCQGKQRHTKNYVFRFLNEDGEIVEPIPQYDTSRHSGAKRSVVGINVKTNEEIEFISIAEAQRATGATNISKVLNGKYTQSAGFKWKYKEE